MRTTATKQPYQAPIHQKPVRATPEPVARSLSTGLTGSAMLQRKPGCACGGGCPRCQEGALLQTKLKISEPGDQYEQEADRIADRVMRMPESSIQRQMEPEEEEEMVQRKEIANQVLSSEQKSEFSEIPPIVHEVLNSSGQSLDSGTRTFMESRFGHDFSQVRVHTDAKAAESARAVNAQAFTVKQSIVFGDGQYVPSTASGKRVLAHELVHVTQQDSYQAANNRIFRIPGHCAYGATCEKPDTPDARGSGSATTWKLILAVDREEKTVTRGLKSGNVGHTWVKLTDNSGARYSYGFWPEDGPVRPFYKSVPGCTHHPDILHEPPKTIDYIDLDYNLPYAAYLKALTYAQDICKKPPNYNLIKNNCSTFAIEVAKTAGVSPPPSTTLAIHNPNALYKGIEEERRRRYEN